jgi:mono/diheme cytochrome c family protein
MSYRILKARKNRFRSGRLIAILAVAAIGLPAAAQAQDALVARGKYLVQVAGCGDCHTPGHFYGKPDPARVLGGSDIGFQVPGVGTFVAPNLTPDKKTGLGEWTADQIVTALQTGVVPDGRILSPIMPWRTYAGLTKPDVRAIAAYLRSLPPVEHEVAGSFGPDDGPKAVVVTIVATEPPPAAQ